MIVLSNAERLPMHITVFALLIAYLLPTRTDCWNFLLTGLSQDVYISRFAIWRNRAFLAVPRHQAESKSFPRPTLLEAPWPESSSHRLTLKFPAFLEDGRRRGKCEKFLSVTALDVDARGRLWILDAPSEGHCPAKVVIYDLKRNNQKIMSTELTAVPTQSLWTIVIDPIAGPWGSKAYVGDPGDESIIVLSLGKKTWWRINMVRGVGVPHVLSADMAISRRNSLLYVTGRQTHDMFCFSLDQTRIQEEPAINGGVQNVTVAWLGTKLGASTGLLADHKDGLHYFLTSEKASVRWDTKYELTAEAHSILLQDKDVPCITDYAIDAQRNVWGLINHDCSSLGKKNISMRAALKSRTIKVFKNSFSL